LVILAQGDPPHAPPGAVPVQPPTVRSKEDRAFGALADGQVDRPGGARRERDGDDLAAFRGDDHGAMAALDAHDLNVGAGSFGHPQPVQRQQGDQCMLGGRASPAATSSAPSSLRSSPIACDS
jgi:hypothetical protein